MKLNALLDPLGSVLDIADTALSVVASMWYFPVGLLTVLINGWLYWRTQLYADVGLQCLYVGFFLYGWFYWLRGGPERSKAKVVWASYRLCLGLLCLSGVAAFIVHAVLLHTPSTTPWWDASTSVLYLLGQWMMGRKYIQCWGVWLFADVLYLGLYAIKGMPSHAVMEGIYVFLACGGFAYWYRLARQPAAESSTCTPSDGVMVAS